MSSPQKIRKWTTKENTRIVNVLLDKLVRVGGLLDFEQTCQELKESYCTIEETRKHVMEILNTRSHFTNYEPVVRIKLLCMLQVPVTNTCLKWLFTNGDVEVDHLQRIISFKAYEDGIRIGELDTSNIFPGAEQHRNMLHFLAHLAQRETVPVTNRYLAVKYKELKDHFFKVHDLIPLFEECKSQILKFGAALSILVRMAFITQIPITKQLVVRVKKAFHGINVDEEMKVTRFITNNGLVNLKRMNGLKKDLRPISKGYREIELDLVPLEQKPEVLEPAREVKIEEPQLLEVKIEEPQLLEVKIEEPQLLEVKQEIPVESLNTPKVEKSPSPPPIVYYNYKKFLEFFNQQLDILEPALVKKAMVDIEKEHKNAEDSQMIEIKRIKTALNFAIIKLTKFKKPFGSETLSVSLAAIMTFFSEFIQLLECPELEEIFEKIGKLENSDAFERSQVNLEIAQQIFDYVLMVCRPAR